MTQNESMFVSASLTCMIAAAVAVFVNTAACCFITGLGLVFLITYWGNRLSREIKQQERE